MRLHEIAVEAQVCVGNTRTKQSEVLGRQAMQASSAAPTRRLRRKTNVGHIAVAMLATAAAMPPVPAEAWADTFLVPAEAWADTFLDAEGLAPETNKRKAVYLVTLPHPQTACGALGTWSLNSPGSFDRLAIVNMFLDIFARPLASDPAANHREANATTVEEMVVYQEKHAADANGVRHIHYHIALRASNTFRFVAYKRALRERYNLASHWSDTHDGYWSAVRYGFIPTSKKPQSELDSECLTWGRHAPHRPLFQASQEPVTAAATKRRREAASKKASEQGKPEPRPKEHDLYAVIVEQGFQNTPDQPWAYKKLISYLKQNEPALWQFAFRMRARLAALIDDVWSWEKVDDDLALLGQSRLERFQIALHSQCVCQGLWRQYAEWALQANALNATQLCSDILRSITHGRHESLPVVVLVGKHGGEGKSFLLAPLRQIFGKEYVQETPQPGSFPLLGLETKRIAVLEEWEFDNTVIPFSTQLLWFEGKSFPLTRPQNKDYCGHLLYQGTAPVFITCKEKAMAPIFGRAQVARSQGLPSQDTMLLRRLHTYCLSQPLPVQPGVPIQECPHCFANMIAWHSAQGSS